MNESAPPLRVRIMSWNIHKGVGGVDRRYNLDRIIDVLEHYQPDFALLQEVAQDIPGLRRDDQAARLSTAFGGHHAFFPEHQFRVGHYGNLILSRFPLHDVKRLDLTVGWRKRRGLIQAHARVRQHGHQRSLAIHNLHLGLAGSERGIQLQRFVGAGPFKRVHATTPLIVAGDLNDLWGSLGPRYLAPEGLVRAGRLVNTFPAALPLRPLDGIFFRGDLTVLHFARARSQLAKAASDHLPIYADFSLSFSR